jgi:nicotinate-nucleotide pyrophosphorylase (carboxylating)
MIEEHLNRFIQNALKEDIGKGDFSSIACIPESHKGKARLIIKENGIIAGIDISSRVFEQVDNEIRFNPFIQDGDKVNIRDIAFEVEGKTRSILMAERLVLNILQRMSGIATHTNAFVEKVKGLPVKILDTRKTTPGIRFLEKAAVKAGGGENHRMGLYDMIMLKDNHIDYAGGIENAIEKTNQFLQHNQLNLKVVIEARTIDCVKEILQTGKIDRILLDNMSPQQITASIGLIGGRFETEASGNIHLGNVREYAECGVNYISIGAITHQIDSIDMSLKAI